jgi:RNA polymerase sigma factor (sigma-70 family)
MSNLGPPPRRSEVDAVQSELERLHAESFGWALTCCFRDTTLAEDVLQIVYMKILEGKARYGGRASFKTWLFAVIRKTARGEMRRAFLRRLLPARAWRLTDDDPGSLDRNLARVEDQEALRQALGGLSTRQREVLQLVFYHDLSVEQAADVMCVSLGTARVHYDRGKKRLRELLRDREGSQWSSILTKAESG